MPSPKIVVATDFSPRADRAIDRALQLCQQHGLGLKAIHALDHIDADKADWSYLEERMSRTVGETSCPTEFEFPEGSPPRAIARTAQSDDTYMLLLGPARYNTLGDFFLGTAVDFILRHTECPTLVVKHRARAPYGHIVVGTDFSPASAHAIIEAARLFPDTRIHVVHAWHVPFAGFQRDEYVRDQTELEPIRPDYRSLHPSAGLAVPGAQAVDQEDEKHQSIQANGHAQEVIKLHTQ